MSLIRSHGFYDRVLEGWLTVHKFGSNPAITTATDPEEIWSVGGVFTYANQFPAAATTVTLVCASTDDDIAGTGARTVTIVGINGAGAELSQTVNCEGNDGAGGITSVPVDLKRVHRMYVASVGAGATHTNVGAIDATIGGNVVAQIEAGAGQTEMAVYTVPTGYSKYYLTNWSVRVSGIVAAAEAYCTLMLHRSGVVRHQGDVVAVKTGATLADVRLDNWITLLAGDDVWIRVQEVSATTAVAGTFDIVGIP